MRCSAYKSTVGKSPLGKRFAQLFGNDSDDDTISPKKRNKESMRKRLIQLFGNDNDGDTISPIQKRSAPTCSTQLFDDDSDNDDISTIQKRQLLVKIPIGNQLRVDPRLVDPRLVRTEIDVPQETSWKLIPIDVITKWGVKYVLTPLT